MKTTATERLGYRVYRALSSLKRRAVRRLTPGGWLIVLGLLATAALGLDPERSVAYRTFALLLCVFLVAMGSVFFFRGRFVLERRISRFGSVGQPLPYFVTVGNKTKHLFRDLELIEDLGDVRPTLFEFVERHRSRVGRGTMLLTVAQALSSKANRAMAKIQPLTALPPYGRVETRLHLFPLRRGVLRLEGMIVARADPFGLFRGFQRVSAEESVVILPRRYSVPPLSLPGTLKYQQGGVPLASAVGESEEFVALRDYRPGDPLRRIHWRSWAKTGRLIVKEYEDEFFVRHALVLDTFARSGQSAAFEEAVSIAASFACTITTQESLLDLMFIGSRAVCFTSGRGLGHAEQALEILAGVEVCREQPFAQLEQLLLHHAAEVSGCICVLLDWDQPRRELLRRLQDLGMPLLILVVAEPAAAERIRSNVEVGRPERFHVIEVGKAAEQLAVLV